MTALRRISPFEVVVTAPKSSRSFNVPKNAAAAPAGEFDRARELEQFTVSRKRRIARTLCFEAIPDGKTVSHFSWSCSREKRRSRHDASGAAETERARSRGCHRLSKRYCTQPLRTTRKDAEPPSLRRPLSSTPSPPRRSCVFGTDSHFHPSEASSGEFSSRIRVTSL